MPDTRTKSQRIYDEAVRTRAETHRRDRLRYGAEVDPVEHIKTCELCMTETRKHAEQCGDGKLLLAAVET